MQIMVILLQVTQPPSHKRSLEIANQQFAEAKTKLENILRVELPKAERALTQVGAPWITGQDIP